MKKHTMDLIETAFVILAILAAVFIVVILCWQVVEIVHSRILH